MTKRDVALNRAKCAGYHGDASSFARLIIESRVARPKMNQAYWLGQQAKIAGVPCNCFECRP